MGKRIPFEQLRRMPKFRSSKPRGVFPGAERRIVPDLPKPADSSPEEE